VSEVEDILYDLRDAYSDAEATTPYVGKVGVSQSKFREMLDQLVTAVSAQARAEAIEECAKVCDSEARKLDDGEERNRAMVAEFLAMQLRTLKAQEPCKTCGDTKVSGWDTSKNKPIWCPGCQGERPCLNCRGSGIVQIQLDEHPDVDGTCTYCKGTGKC